MSVAKKEFSEERTQWFPADGDLPAVMIRTTTLTEITISIDEPGDSKKQAGSRPPETRSRAKAGDRRKRTP